MAKLADCLGKAKREGILTDAEMAFVLKRASELKDEKQAISEIHAQRLKEYEAIKSPAAKDRTVTQTQNENVAMASYMEEVRIATKEAVSPEKKAFEEARAAGEAKITGQPAAAPSSDTDIEATRQFLVSSQQQGHTVRPTTEQMHQTARDMGTKLLALRGVGNVKLQDTFGMYQGAHDRQFETSFDAKPDANLMALVQEMAREAGRKGQDSITISRVLEPGEDSGNARPGIDIEFKRPIPIEMIDSIVQFLRARGIDGFTLIPGGYDTATGTPRTFKGLRFQEIPEFSQQPKATKHAALLELQEELMKMDEVAGVTHQLYDTLVLTSQDYDKNGILAGAVGAVRAAAWADRAFFAANPKAAGERVKAGPITEAQAAQVKPGEPQALTSKELETAAAALAAGKSAAPIALLTYQDIYRRVVSLMQQNRVALEGMKWSPATTEAIGKQALIRALAELDAMLKYVPAEVRGKVGGYFQLAKAGMGEKALAKFFGDRVRTLERVLEQYLKKQYESEINDLLDANKPKTTGGIKKSARMDADAQAAVDSARKFSKMDADEVASTLRSLDAEITNAASDVEDSSKAAELVARAERDSAILALFGDLKHRSAAELYSAYQWLKDVVETGKDNWKAKADAEKARNLARGQELVALIGPADLPGLGVSRQKAETYLTNINGWFKSHESFLQFLDYLIPGASFVRDWQRMARQSDNGKMDFQAAAGERLHKALTDAIGSTNFFKVTMANWELKRVHKDAVHLKGKPWKMSKLDAIQFILSWNQTDVREKMEKMGITEETMEEMRTLASDNVSQGLLAFLQGEYAQMYDLVNPLYRQIYGMDLPRILFYAPTRFWHDKSTAGEVAPFGGIINTSGSTASFAHQRVRHSASMAQESATTVFWQHVNDVSHFLNDAQMNREIRAVLSQKDVREAIIAKFGTKVWEQASAWMGLMGKAANTRNTELSVVNYFIDSLATMQALTSLAGNIKSVLLQSDSSMRVVFERDTKTIVQSVVSMLNPAEAASEWYRAFSSPSVQRRIKLGSSPAVRYIIEKSNFRPNMFLDFARINMLPIVYGDAYATSISAAVSFRAAFLEAKDMGMLDAAATDYATDKMDESIYRYNQPVGMFNRSLQEQTGGPIKRLYMMFMSDLRLKTAIQMEAARDLVQGKPWPAVRSAIRKILAVEALSVMGYVMSDAFKYAFTDTDDDDLWTAGGFMRALALPPMAGIFFLGGAWDSATAILLEGKWLDAVRDPMVASGQRAYRAVKNWEDIWNLDDPQDMIKEWENISKSLAIAGVFVAPPLVPPAAAIAVATNLLKPLAGVFAERKN